MPIIVTKESDTEALLTETKETQKSWKLSNLRIELVILNKQLVRMDNQYTINRKALVDRIAELEKAILDAENLGIEG